MPFQARRLAPVVAVLPLLVLLPPGEGASAAPGSSAGEAVGARYRETAGRVLGRALEDEDAWRKLDMSRGLLLGLAIALGAAKDGRAQQPSQPSPAAPTTLSEHVTVTATRIAEDAVEVPASVSVFTAEELRDLGASDLRSALALAAGVDVDGVPWGGPFAPDLATLDLGDVERIELLRGSAPVMYGPTSFSGVIQVVRKAPGATTRRATLRGGSHASGGAGLELPLPLHGGWGSSLSLDGGRQGYDDPRTHWARGHALWRNRHLATRLEQSPASPHPREGGGLSARVPLDANHNPADAFLDRTRVVLTAGYDRQRASGIWSTQVSYAHAATGSRRGFLSDLSSPVASAVGFRQDIGIDELYADTHLEWTRSTRLRAVAGLDWLHGNGSAEGFAFDYRVPLDRAVAVTQADATPAARRHVGDRRDFLGGYGFVEWNPAARWRAEAGLRLNVTNEARDEGKGDAPAGAEPSRSDVRPAGSLALSWTPWSRGRDLVRLFAGYRNTFKPAVFDFGLGEAEEGGLLRPETAQSYELGARGRLLENRLALELSSFLMDFENLVVARSVSGLPGLQNVGSQRFKGVEASLSLRLRARLRLRGGYSFHDSRFRDFVADFDGVPTQLAGRRFELAPRHLATAALVYAPDDGRGPLAILSVRHVGDRYLNKRNTALASPYTTVTAALGWRTRRFEARVDGANLGDARPAVAESEIGDAQYYRLPGRRVDVSLGLRF
jgi:iron complex outermembrane receptor protein